MVVVAVCTVMCIKILWASNGSAESDSQGMSGESWQEKRSRRRPGLVEFTVFLRVTLPGSWHLGFRLHFAYAPKFFV